MRYWARGEGDWYREMSSLQPIIVVLCNGTLSFSISAVIVSSFYDAVLKGNLCQVFNDSSPGLLLL